jgi:hypothetical protein
VVIDCCHSPNSKFERLITFNYNVKVYKMKKIVVLLLSLLVSAAFAFPVLAQPAQKTVFLAVQVPNANIPQPDITTWVTDGDTVHVRDMAGAGRIWFNTATPSGPATGTTISDIMSDINLKTGQGNIKFVMTWTIGAGSYEGNIVGKCVAAPYTQGATNYDMYLHGVLQGKDAYAGQTITLDGTRLVGHPFEWTCTLITP